MVIGQFSDRREIEKLRVRVLASRQSFVNGGGGGGGWLGTRNLTFFTYLRWPTHLSQNKFLHFLEQIP